MILEKEVTEKVAVVDTKIKCCLYSGVLFLLSAFSLQFLESSQLEPADFLLFKYIIVLLLSRS